MRLNLAELRESKRTLKRANAKPVRGENGKFVVMTHPDSAYDLESDSNITNIFQYSTSPKHNDEIFEPSFRDLPLGFRLYESTNCRVFLAAGLSSADVYVTHVLADGAYGVANYEALPNQIMRKPLGSGGATGDPLSQIASIGWKGSHAAVILDQARQVVIEHSSSAGAMG